VPKPLHDPAGEFAIVLYYPTVVDKPAVVEDNEEEPPKPVLKVHKSLVDISEIEEGERGKSQGASCY